MYIKVNGIDLYYEEYGDENAPPVVFLHGNAGSMKTFQKTKEVFLKDKRVFLLDSRGHGKTVFEGKIDFPTMGADVAEFITAKGLKDVSLVGYSDGGIVALETAAILGGVVKNMVVIGANLRFDGVKKAERAVLKAAYAFFSLFSFLKKYKQLKKCFYIMLSQPEITEEKLKKITAKTLVAAGEHDIIEEKHTKEIAEKLPDSELLIVEGADHFFFSKRNDQINEIIKNFI
ncbi:MAG: alpha/beta hydrolase [Clostridiales bacterium]|jgi:pimeloyl-ACP methyl ester carboxylesterase|nr:alpha/beta hydrolase [Clostridiales bacterium]